MRAKGVADGLGLRLARPASAAHGIGFSISDRSGLRHPGLAGAAARDAR
jgi:hypothetical protein